MIRLLTIFAVTASVFLLAGSADAAGYSKKQCQQLEQEYKTLQKKEKAGHATPADKKRMSEIDGLTNVYCEGQ